MSRWRLFWKILLGFLVTFLIITQGVWLAFTVRNDRRQPPAPLMAEQVGPALLAAAAQAIEAGGRRRYEAMLQCLPQSQVARLEVWPESEPLPPLASDAEMNTALLREARAPDGTRFRLRFLYHSDRKWRFNAPPELLGVGFLAGLVFSGFLAWYLVRPVITLRRGFQRLAAGELSTRVSPAIGGRRDELADLAHEFDRMARRLEQLVEHRTRLLHDVSHELRSPLARLQLAMALARQNPARQESAMDRMEREVERLDALVGELLTLARAENAQGPGDEYFDVVGIVESVLADASYEAQPKGIAIHHRLDCPPEDTRAPIHGNAELLRRAIDNVLRNALRFTPPGGEIALTARWEAEGALYRITVSDSGPGVAQDQVAAIFDPFVRGIDGRGEDTRGYRAHGAGDTGGLGLGLAIAARALAAHGGSATARNRPEGGLEITMTVPAARPA